MQKFTSPYFSDADSLITLLNSGDDWWFEDQYSQVDVLTADLILWAAEQIKRTAIPEKPVPPREKAAGDPCEKCWSGKYFETSVMDDINGVMHCNYCGHRTHVRTYMGNSNV